MIYITVPTNEDLFGKNKLDIINKIGLPANVTDYAIINGIFVGDYYTDIIRSNLANRTGYYITKFEENDEHNHVVIIDGSGLAHTHDYRFAGVRPIIHYDTLEELTNELIIENDIKYINYGQYPMNVVNSKQQNILESLFQNEELTISKDVISQNVSLNYDDFIPGYKIVYELDGKKYIRCHINKDLIYGKDGVILSDGNFYPVDSYAWINIEKIKWYVNERHKTLLSENVLFSARGYHEPLSYEQGLEDNGIDYFLNNSFKEEINSNSKVKKLTRK
ncbi:MAG: hypothetical protein IJ574_03025 [Bacilli bacterium]|nr:hypothetical protein [Bacilli bacterium]